MDANNNYLDISNEERIIITNEQRSFNVLNAPMLCRCDEGSKSDEEGNTTIFNKCCEKIGWRNRTKNAMFGIFRRIECNNIGKTNDSNKDNISKNISEEIDLNDNGENEICRDDLSKDISEGMEHDDNSETNDSNREDLSENFSSQETQSSRKLVVNTSKTSVENKENKEIQLWKREQVQKFVEIICVTH